MARKEPEKDIEPSVIKIKKYANRRLYNMKTSSYVTLEDMGEMVKSNQDFIVVDARTGNDITQTILTQIIFEEEAKGQSLLPTSFLRQLIQLYGHTLQGVVPSYLEQSMQMFTAQQDSLYKTFGANPTVANLSQITQTNIDVFQKAMEMFVPFKANPSGVSDTSEAHQEQPETEINVDKIKKQLADLQSQLNSLTQSKK